ncbi:zinc resistance sensor/chaperone ZraP [Kosakonia oryziphila]|jgi:P pilus assembly/Cpx signaling pathway, periplasmic inhibitor/zinc-resistance associated protein|uniref:Zinc resistance-associated protein n=1 Tax=Kosakonia oryziphila TaxID=1005667 RepID=A0A1C4GGD8_9ENTR|nr:zinc resistance sensor/chaperone ZraP [Kosakonia oryziphila]SCC67237.1 zinc resistance-associated protein [Kosakonia oryziphila]
MKQNKQIVLALVAMVMMAMGSTAALARGGWGNHGGMWQQGASPLTTEQQAAAQKIYDGYYAQTSTLRQQLASKHYEYNALLTASAPDSNKVNAVAKEIASLNQSLDESRVKRDIALAQAGIPRGGMGYNGCGGGGHMGGMGHW